VKQEVCRDGGRYMQEYSQGKRKSAVKKVGASKLHGTIITFEPDKEIFGDIKFDWNTDRKSYSPASLFGKKIKNFNY
jgi:DNA gyrase subunit B